MHDYTKEMTLMATSTFTASLEKTKEQQIHSVTIGNNRHVNVCPPPMVMDTTDTTSPHHLFLASIGACVNLVFEIALEKARIELIDLRSSITGEYETDDDTGKSQFTTIIIDTKVTVPEGVPEKRLERLFELSHANCPIGNCLIGSCVKLVTSLDIEYQ